MHHRWFAVAAFTAIIASSIACNKSDAAGSSAAASSSAVTVTTSSAHPPAALASSAPAASTNAVASAAPSASAVKPSFTATPGVHWDPHGYPGGFTSECDHKLNKVNKQPEEYADGPSCEKKWAPSCEAVLKCVKGDPAFK